MAIKLQVPGVNSWFLNPDGTSLETLTSGSVPGPTNIKVGWGQWQPKATQWTPVQAQVQTMQQQYWNKTIDDIYSAMLANKPTKTDITMAIGQNTGLLDRMNWVRAQMAEINKAMMWDQTQIFSATNPDGTPIDPRVKMAQYQDSLKQYSQRLWQLGEMEATYKAELWVLSTMEQERIDKENEKNKITLSYLSDLNQEKWKKKEFDTNQSWKQKDFQMEKDKFNWQKSTDSRDFNTKIDQYNKDKTKPELRQDSNGNFVFLSPGEDWVSGHWDWQITYTGWRVPWDEWVDIAGKEWFAVTTPFEGTVEKVFKGNDKYFWSYIEIKNPDWTKTRISHLDPESIIVEPGQKLSAGNYFANQKNTGTVMAWKWRGVIDVTMFDKNGQKIKWDVTAKMLKGIKNNANVEQTWVKGPTTWSKDKDFSSFIKTLDIEKLTSFDDLDSVAKEINRMYPEMDLEDVKDSNGKVTKKWIISVLENMLTDEQYDAFMKQEEANKKDNFFNPFGNNYMGQGSILGNILN